MRPKGSQGSTGSRGRHLRRAWRRPREHRVLPRDRTELRLVLAVPSPGRPAGGGPRETTPGNRPGQGYLTEDAHGGPREFPLFSAHPVHRGLRAAAALSDLDSELTAVRPRTLA